MSKNLYRVEQFHRAGSTTVTDSVDLVVGEQIDSRYQDKVDWPQLSAGAEGTVIVVATEYATDHPRTIEAGLRIRRLPDFRANRIVYDSHAKEYVMITNGTCVLEHFKGTEEYTRSHDANGGQCHYAPSEGIALRPSVSDSGKVQLAWTYRSLNPCDLEPVNNEELIRAQFEAVLSQRRSKTFVGRI